MLSDARALWVGRRPKRRSPTCARRRPCCAARSRSSDSSSRPSDSTQRTHTRDHSPRRVQKKTRVLSPSLSLSLSLSLSIKKSKSFPRRKEGKKAETRSSEGGSAVDQLAASLRYVRKESSLSPADPASLLLLLLLLLLRERDTDTRRSGLDRDAVHGSFPLYAFLSRVRGIQNETPLGAGQSRSLARILFIRQLPSRAMGTRFTFLERLERGTLERFKSPIWTIESSYDSHASCGFPQHTLEMGQFTRNQTRATFKHLM